MDERWTKGGNGMDRNLAKGRATEAESRHAIGHPGEITKGRGTGNL